MVTRLMERWYLWRISRTPRDWLLEGNKIRRPNDDGIFFDCPLEAIDAYQPIWYRGHFNRAQRHIIGAADRRTAPLRTELLKACGLEEV